MDAPYVQEPDLTVHVGDVRDVLPTLEAESVDCVVTSPPYWGLRDYGTGAWDGGDPDCDHLAPLGGGFESTGLMLDGRSEQARDGNAERVVTDRRQQFRDVCGKCGARRVDRQLGLEATLDEYVDNLVAVFREIRRVLRPAGTVWLNLGDSYANKQRQMMPARVALALQADGWWLRSEIVWSKKNPMPASVTDRPTDAHEMVYLLSKQPRYFFDQEAVREPAEWARWGDQTNGKHEGSGGAAGWIGDKSREELQRRSTPTWQAAGATRGNVAFGDNVGAGTQRGVHGEGVSHDLGDPARGRNVRSVWSIATQPYAEAHFAVFPEELARRCVLAGCPEQVCGTCGRARERISERERDDDHLVRAQKDGASSARRADGTRLTSGSGHRTNENGTVPSYSSPRVKTVGWSDCGHGNYQPGTVLDPFGGAGTTALVARRLGRRSVLVELNEEYAAMAAERLTTWYKRPERPPDVDPDQLTLDAV